MRPEIFPFGNVGLGDRVDAFQPKSTFDQSSDLTVWIWTALGFRVWSRAGKARGG